jgi:hypothetical protein
VQNQRFDPQQPALPRRRRNLPGEAELARRDAVHA